MRNPVGSPFVCWTLAALASLASPAFSAQPLGTNDGSVDFVDLVKSNGNWNPITGSAAVPLDANGWPTADCQAVFQDQRKNMPWRATDAPGINADISGVYHLSFVGQATISGSTETGASGVTIQNQSYDPASNTTRADAVLAPSHWLMVLNFSNTRRLPGDAAPTGFTGMRLILPGYPADTTQLFTTGTLASYGQPFSAIRFLGADAANSYQNFYGANLFTARWADRVQVTDARVGGLPQSNTLGKQARGASSVFPANTGAITVTLMSRGGPGAAPSAPANVRVTVAGTIANLQWAATASATGYRVARSNASGGPYTPVGSVSANSFSDTGLTNGPTYYYVISALNAAGEGGLSPQIAVIPTSASPPAPPVISSVTSGAGDATPFFPGGEVILTWAPVPNATSYNIKWSTTSGGPYSNKRVQLATTYNNLFSDYDTTFGSLTPGTTYYFVVSAVNSFGESANSPETAVTPVEQVRAAPVLYQASVINGHVFLAWRPDILTAPQFGLAFNVKRSSTPGGPYTTAIQLNTFNAYDYTAVPGQTYYYVVSGTNCKGESANSNELGVAAP